MITIYTPRFNIIKLCILSTQCICVFPVRYELNSYILFRRNSVFKGLIKRKAMKTYWEREADLHLGIGWEWPVSR
jgi:hypothetical protein